MFYTEVVVYQYEEYSYKKATTFINFLPDMLRQNVICYLGSKSDILPTELLAPLHAYYVPWIMYTLSPWIHRLQITAVNKLFETKEWLIHVLFHIFFIKIHCTHQWDSSNEHQQPMFLLRYKLRPEFFLLDELQIFQKEENKINLYDYFYFIRRIEINFCFVEKIRYFWGSVCVFLRVTLFKVIALCRFLGKLWNI